MLKRLVELHVSVYKYLVKELKKKRTLAKNILFVLDILRQYFIALYQDYRMFLSIEYRLQKKEYEKRQRAKKDLYNAWKIVQLMLKMEGNRKEKKQIRRDFIKDGRISKELEAEILKELYGIGA